MSDIFTTIVRSPVARKVGVPQPTRLRRYEPGMPLCEGPVLVAGDGRFADGIAAWLGGAGVPAVSTPPGEGDKVGAASTYGIIRFGSRVDTYLPAGSELVIGRGQRTIGGETVLARLASTPDTIDPA